jgi:hypothetical protein
MGVISFYEGPDCTESLVWSLADEVGQDIRPNRFAPIRSLKLRNVRAGADIRLYDAPREAPNDYACIIKVKQSASEYTVAGFARTYADEFVSVSVVRNNSSKGKVARIRIG